MKPLSDHKTKELAMLQLQLAVLEGKEWAIKMMLGAPDLSIGGTEDSKWEVEITHVKKEVNESTN